MEYSNESSSDSSSSSGLEDSGEDINVEGEVNMIQPYAFEPVEETDSDDDVDEEMPIEDESNSESENATSRLEDTNW